MAKERCDSGGSFAPLFPRPEDVRGNTQLFGCAVFHQVLQRISASRIQYEDFVDLVQEGCLRLLRNEKFLQRCREGAKEDVRAIAVTSARNAWWHYLIDKGRHRTLPLANSLLEALVVKPTDWDRTNPERFIDAVEESLGALEIGYRHALILIGFFDSTRSAAARASGVSRRKLDRLLRKVRALLESWGRET
jgi:DNA-directed RNA polymerase specialized sigma24 family protein